MPAKPVKPPRDDGLSSIHDFDWFTGQVLYVPLPRDTQLRMGSARNMAKLKYLGSRRPLNKLIGVMSETEHLECARLWVLQFQDLHAANDIPMSLTIHSDGTVMLGNCRSKFFSNYWFAYAWGLQAERTGWGQ